MGETVKKPRIYNWHLSEIEWHGKNYLVARGYVWGSNRFIDSITLRTSEVKNIKYDYDQKMCLIQTRNTLYYCPMEYFDIEGQERHLDLMSKSDFENLKELVENRQNSTIDAGSVLLTISTFSFYYFHDIYYLEPGQTEKEEFDVHSHIGMIQDSFLISGLNTRMDIRYFPHPYSIEFYSVEIGDRPFYVENVGFDALDVGTEYGVIHLEPGDRKKIDRKSTDKDRKILLKSDLYPGGHF